MVFCMLKLEITGAKITWTVPLIRLEFLRNTSQKPQNVEARVHPDMNGSPLLLYKFGYHRPGFTPPSDPWVILYLSLGLLDPL